MIKLGKSMARSWIRNALLVVLMAAPSTAQAQKPEQQVGFSKAETVLLVVPSVFKKDTASGMMSMVKEDITVRTQNGVVEVFDPATKLWTAAWRSAGFPPLTAYNIWNIKTVDRAGWGRQIEMTLRASDHHDVRLFSAVDQPKAIASLIVRASARDSVVKVSYDSLGAVFFTGPLASITPKERDLLLHFAHVTANGTRIGHEEFKSITYMTVHVPGDGNTWNDLVVTRSKRIGKLISDQLTLLKLFAKISVPHEAIGGLEIVQFSRHGSAPYYPDTATEKIEAYFPMDAVLKFANADITSQQLINSSIILVDGNRVEVDLSSQ